MNRGTRIGWAQLAFISAGGLIWAVRFVVIYSFAAIACAKDWSQPRLQIWDGVHVLIAIMTILALLANLAVIALAVKWARQRPEEGNGTPAFIPYTAVGIALLAIVAIVWESFVFMLPLCR